MPPASGLFLWKQSIRYKLNPHLQIQFLSMSWEHLYCLIWLVLLFFVQKAIASTIDALNDVISKHP